MHYVMRWYKSELQELWSDESVFKGQIIYKTSGLRKVYEIHKKTTAVHFLK